MARTSTTRTLTSARSFWRCSAGRVDFGADGVRVDGAQDFKWWDATEQGLRHDDEYLREMSGIRPECRRHRLTGPGSSSRTGRALARGGLGGCPRPTAPSSRTSRTTTSFQWGPLTFAHNTPFIYTYWLSKYWRIREMLAHGANWISGTANHDTLRRGTQVSPKLNINTPPRRHADGDSSTRPMTTRPCRS